MVDFNFASTITYSQNGNSDNFALDQAEAVGAGTLSDGNLDGVFTYGETLTGGIPGGVFIGTVDLGGVIAVAVRQSNPGSNSDIVVLYLESTPAGAPPPASISDPTDLSIDNFTPCFLAGTLIATPCGEVPVESLAIGDRVSLYAGGVATVRWLAHKSVDTRFSSTSRSRPVRFTRDALGIGYPHTDLTVTADHAVSIDGVLCEASALVNGSTISFVGPEETGERFMVYHIETENHELVVANGVASETFIDNTSRRVFDNFSEYLELYGDEENVDELPAPRAVSYRQLPFSVRRKLLTENAA